MKTKIYNGTPHAINIIEKGSVIFSKDIRKYISLNPVTIRSIPSDGILSAQFQQKELEPIEGIPVSIKVLVSFDYKPEADVIICSAIYFKAVQDSGNDTRNLYTIIDPVYDITGTKVLGCLYIGRV